MKSETGHIALLKREVFQTRTVSYRFGFNGMENDEEINAIDFGARIYDGRLGRWLSVDPLYGYTPSSSPYSFAFNSPISFVDIAGEIAWPIQAKYVGKSTYNGVMSNARISRNFNQWRKNKIIGKRYQHKGTDINWGSGSQDEGIPVVSTASGVVSYAYQAVGAGHYIVVTHNEKYRTRYLHLDPNSIVQKSGRVREGDVIGGISNSGTTDVHLHYEIEEFIDGKWVPISPYDANGALKDVQVLVNGSAAPISSSIDFEIKLPDVSSAVDQVLYVAPRPKPIIQKNNVDLEKIRGSFFNGFIVQPSNPSVGIGGENMTPIPTIQPTNIDNCNE